MINLTCLLLLSLVCVIALLVLHLFTNTKWLFWRKQRKRSIDEDGDSDNSLSGKQITKERRFLLLLFFFLLILFMFHLTLTKLSPASKLYFFYIRRCIDCHYKHTLKTFNQVFIQLTTVQNENPASGQPSQSFLWVIFWPSFSLFFLFLQSGAKVEGSASSCRMKTSPLRLKVTGRDWTCWLIIRYSRYCVF